jgi:hypothetical protein
MRVAHSLAIGLAFVAAACGGQMEATPGISDASADASAVCPSALTSAEEGYKTALAAAQSCDPQSTALQCDNAALDVCGCQILSNVDPARRAALASAVTNLRAMFSGPECSSRSIVCAHGVGCAGFPGPAGPGGPKLGCLPSAVCGYSN